MSSVSPRFLSFTAFFLGFSLCQGQSETGDTPPVELPIIEAPATNDLKGLEGRKVIVFGETGASEKSPSGTNFVRFKGADFYLTAFKSDLEPFRQGEPADLYEGKRIAVTGVISIYRDNPQIKLTSPDQVRILGADEIFPPEKTTEADEDPLEPAAVVAVAVAPEVAEPEPPRENPPVDWRKFFK